MSVSVGYKELADILWRQLNLDETKQAIVALRGIDWNPFNEDADAYDGVFQEINHNFDLVFDATSKVVAALQRAVYDGVSLSNPEKHKVAVELLDRLIRLPFYLEPFDGVAIDMLVKGAVKFVKAINWGIELPPEIPEKIEFREVG